MGIHYSSLQSPLLLSSFYGEQKPRLAIKMREFYNSSPQLWNTSPFSIHYLDQLKQTKIYEKDKKSSSQKSTFSC